MRTSAVSAVLGMAMAVAAKDIPVNVGKGGQLVFDPDTITAAKGDVLVFTFFGVSHSVTQGDFNGPACAPPSDGGFNSGFNPPAAGATTADKVFRVQINDTNPIVFYCAQPAFQHCKSGMVGVVNPDDAHSLDAYKANASSVDMPVLPDGVTGGLLVSASDSSSSGDSSSSTSGSSAPASTSAAGSAGSGSDSTSGSCGLYSSCPSTSTGTSLGGVAALALGLAVMLL